MEQIPIMFHHQSLKPCFYTDLWTTSLIGNMKASILSQKLVNDPYNATPDHRLNCYRLRINPASVWFAEIHRCNGAILWNNKQFRRFRPFSLSERTAQRYGHPLKATVRVSWFVFFWSVVASHGNSSYSAAFCHHSLCAETSGRTCKNA